jgi:hypothetical protein
LKIQRDNAETSETVDSLKPKVYLDSSTTGEYVLDGPLQVSIPILFPVSLMWHFLVISFAHPFVLSKLSLLASFYPLTMLSGAMVEGSFILALQQLQVARTMGKREGCVHILIQIRKPLFLK